MLSFKNVNGPSVPIQSEGSAFPIEYADILKAQNKNADEIRAIENELQSVSQLDYYLTAR